MGCNELLSRLKRSARKFLLSVTCAAAMKLAFSKQQVLNVCRAILLKFTKQQIVAISRAITQSYKITVSKAMMQSYKITFRRSITAKLQNHFSQKHWCKATQAPFCKALVQSFWNISGRFPDFVAKQTLSWNICRRFLSSRFSLRDTCVSSMSFDWCVRCLVL